MTDTPAPIATPEEVARKIVRGLPSAWRVGSARREQLLVDGITTAIAAALTSSNAEIEGLRLKLELTTAQRDDARAHGEALTDQVGRMREALELQVETFGRQASPPLPIDEDDDDEAERVMRLGDQIGYGNLMDLVSRGWRHRLGEEGDPVGGEFAVGTCVFLAQRAMTVANAALSPTEPEATEK